MKTLILSDDTWAALAKAVDPDALEAILTGSDEVLPDTETLHRVARSGLVPPVFALVRERLAAANDAANDQREAMHALIHEAHAQGVGPAALARWSGYAPARIYQILGPQGFEVTT